MAIKKQEFYEGAAVYLLARSNVIATIRYESPFFLINDKLSVYLKHSTRVRSPWAFTFTPEEQRLLMKEAPNRKIVIGLVCGADGVATLTYDAYQTVAAHRTSAVHISCYREHGEHYEVNGPDGRLDWKVAPSNWQRIMESGND